MNGGGENLFPKQGHFLTGRRAAMLAVGWLILVCLLVHAPTFHGLQSPDAMKYADAARNFLAGKGFVVNQIQPRSLAGRHYTERLPADRIREPLTRHFGYPLVLVGAFALLGASDQIVFLVSCLLWILTGCLLFLLGRQIHSAAVGLLALLLYSLQSKTVAFAVAGTAEMLCLALILGGGCLIVARRRPYAAAVAAGFLGAFALFVRQPMMYVVPICYVGFLSLRRDRHLRTFALLIVGAVVFYGAYLLARPHFFPPPAPFAGQPVAIEKPSRPAPEEPRRNALEAFLYRVLGAQFLLFSNRFPGHTLERSLVDPTAGAQPATESFFAKMRFNAVLLAKALAYKTGSPLLSLLFLLSAIAVWKDRTMRRLIVTVIVLTAVTSVVCLSLFVMDRYFQIYLPFLALVIAGALVHWRETSARFTARRRTALVALVVVLASLPLPFGHFIAPALGDASLRDLAADTRTRKDAIASLLVRRTDKEDIVFSDLPWLTGWYANRPSIWLPLDPADVAELMRWVKADYLLLTLEDPQGFWVWRDWLMSYKSGKLDKTWAEWKLIDGSMTNGRGIYLFQHRVDSPGKLTGDHL